VLVKPGQWCVASALLARRGCSYLVFVVGHVELQIDSG
jgi:hypothetical protein